MNHPFSSDALQSACAPPSVAAEHISGLSQSVSHETQSHSYLRCTNVVLAPNVYPLNRWHAAEFHNGKFRPAGDKLVQPQGSTSANCVPLDESTSRARTEISSPTPPLHPCEPHARSTWNRERFTWQLECFTWNARDHTPNHVSGLCGLNADRASARTSLTDEAQPHVLNRAQTACQST